MNRLRASTRTDSRDCGPCFTGRHDGCIEAHPSKTYRMTSRCPCSDRDHDGADLTPPPGPGTWPADTPTRARLRQQVEDDAAQAARERARLDYRSIRCGDYDEHPCKGGPANCLCPCHDQPDEVSA